MGLFCCFIRILYIVMLMLVFVPIQICDFGLTKWLPKPRSHHVYQCLKPHFGYFMHGIVDGKMMSLLLGCYVWRL